MESHLSKPRIGISCGESAARSLDAICRAVRAKGGDPVLLRQHAKRCVEKDFVGLEGVIVMGNDDDIDPCKYGQERHPETRIESNTARADYEEKLISFALTADVPLLCICGGMQRLNVIGGGTLVQHIDGHLDVDVQPTAPITLIPGTRLYKLAEMKPMVFDNTLHHQVIDVVRPDFRVAARATRDNVIEAIEPAERGLYADHPFAIGVQWHPEYGVSELSVNLTENFIRAAAACSGLVVPHAGEIASAQ